MLFEVKVIFLFTVSALRFVVDPSSMSHPSAGSPVFIAATLTTCVLPERIGVTGVFGVVVNEQVGRTRSLRKSCVQERQQSRKGELNPHDQRSDRRCRGNNVWTTTTNKRVVQRDLIRVTPPEHFCVR